MPTITRSLKGTADLSAQRLVVDIAEGIALLDPNENPFTLMHTKAGKRTAKQPKFSWLEDELQPEVTTVSVAASAASTALSITNSAYVAVGDLWQVFDSYEIMYANSVSSDGYVQFSRNYPGVASTETGYQTVLAAGDYLIRLGNANEEGAAAPTAMMTVESQVDNYTQIVRTPFELTETELNSLMEGEQDLPYETRKKAIEHQRKLEYLAFWGIPSYSGTGTNGKAMRTTGGIWWYLKENAPSGNIVSQAEITESEFLDFIRNGFRYGARNKVLFACPLVLSAIEKWGLAKLQTTSSDKTYGINVTHWTSPHGEISIVNHKMLEGPSPGTAGGWAFLLDMNEIRGVALRNRDTKLRTNIQEPSEDRYEAEYITEFGIEIKNPAKHAVLYSVTSFAA